MKILKKAINIHDFFGRVQHGGSLLILDYDGTLAPFVKDRTKAYPYDGVKERLSALMKLSNTRLVILSGRSLSDLEKLLDIEANLEMWGSHGLERKYVSGKKTSALVDPKLREGLNLGKKFCSDNVDTQYCEIKPYAVALHGRGMNPAEKNRIRYIVENQWKQLTSKYDLEIHYFEEGIELRPKGRNKGEVVQELLSKMANSSAVAYLGDDLTDEEAFAALGDRGLKVLVRHELRETLADILIMPPQELLFFLDHWRRLNE